MKEGIIKEREGYLPHQQRVVDEYVELMRKVTDLNNFIEKNDFFKSLERQEKELLITQLNIMKSYESILRLRIASF